MPPAIEGYEFIGKVGVDQVCDFVYGDNNPVDQFINNNITDNANAIDAFCFGVGLANSYFSTPIGGGISFVACEGAALAGCALQDIIENNTSCNDIVVSVYIVENPNPQLNRYPGLFLIDCENGLLQTTVEDLAAAADEYADDVFKTGQNLVDKAINTGENLIDGGQEFIDSQVPII